MDLKRNIIELKNEIDTKFDLAMSFANSEIVFTDIPFDEVNIQTISAIQNVIYYIKIIDINGSFNSSVFCQKFFKLKSNKKIKFPQVNSNNKSKILYVGKSSTNFKSRIKCHFGDNSLSTYAIHYKTWCNNPKITKLELQLYFYQFSNSIPKDVLEIIESSLHLKLKPLLGRSGH